MRQRRSLRFPTQRTSVKSDEKKNACSRQPLLIFGLLALAYEIYPLYLCHHTDGNDQRSNRHEETFLYSVETV